MAAWGIRLSHSHPCQLSQPLAANDRRVEWWWYGHATDAVVGSSEGAMAWRDRDSAGPKPESNTRPLT
jgi:hypothetical protein